MPNTTVIQQMQCELAALVKQQAWSNEQINIHCAALTTEQAIGTPEHHDYPIQLGRETMLEASFHEYKGQAFSLEIPPGTRYSLEQIITLQPDKDWKRALLVATTNAVFAAIGRTDRTIHCRDKGPADCARLLHEITSGEKVALFGLQPRFLEQLNQLGEVRCIDIDPQLIGTFSGGILIEPPHHAEQLIAWADRLLVTGSAVVNDTFDVFLQTGKPLHVFGITGASACSLKQLTRYCHADTV